MKLQLNCDGGARGNPGPAAYGYVVQDVSSSAAIILEKCGNYLGETTNNQAEYAGLIAGLNWIVTHYPHAQVEVVMDSLLIVNQVKGLYKVKNPELQLRHQEVRGLLAHLSGYTIRHVLRHENSLADELVNQVLDSQN
jgi:ribonuclease HI